MMKPKFQVGDLVRIRKDIPNCGYGPDGVYCNEDMYAHRGKEFEIKSFFGIEPYLRYLLVDHSQSFMGEWVWEESFLEPVEANIEVDATPLL